MLRVGPDADVVGSLVHPEDVTTVLGNLVDNGIDAAARSERTPRWVEVEALRHGDELHLSVMDSGDGAGEPSSPPAAPPAQPEGPEAVHGHGIGLRLSADVARRHGGRLWLAMAGASDHGAVFCAELHGQFEKEDGS
jgi:two-component system CitB family sensor kinase